MTEAEQSLRDYLTDPHAAGAAYDAGEPDRLRKQRNLEPESAHLLWAIALTANATDVLEIGTSNGYSTLWWADAMTRTCGAVTSVDVDAAAQEQAAGHLRACGLAEHARLVCADAGEHLRTVPSATVDVLFLDAERTEYTGWWPHPLRVVRPGGLVVLDNATSPADELAPFVALLDQEPGTDRQLLHVGKGMQIVVKLADSPA
ncbi:MAG: methyltransferase domain-containing protein [Streptosporangiales bacterium]|nr:methyltransferase domain-containing protein [Streptosporangiales bacterium]